MLDDHSPSFETDLPLLERVQEYLYTMLQDEVPDSMLVASWEEFYRVYSELIRRFAIVSGIRGDDVSDCLQDVWTQVVGKLVTFEHPADRPGLRAWLYTLVRSRAIDLVRRNAKHAAERLSDTMQKGQEPASNVLDPQTEYERRWELAMLDILLHELRSRVSATDHRIVVMRLTQGASVEEVATELHLTREQVRYRHHRALKKLRLQHATYTGEQFGAV
jgi:RNA polymerase sigma factor (sigma-70 family)